MTHKKSGPSKIQRIQQSICDLIDVFCKQHLNEEYREICHRMLGVLARKRPSPLINGKASSWACGIVRAVGWVNFLDDPSQTPHVKSTAVDKFFGVSSGTGQARSKQIRDLLKIYTFQVEWSLPSKIDRNPMAWMIQVNGMLVDARWMPPEVQQEAFERGLIPYLPPPNEEYDD